MKKRLFLVLVMLFSFSVDIFAMEEIIITKNTGDDSLLEEEGYYLQDLEIDWSQEGFYQAEYYAPLLRTTISRDITITTSEKLLKGLDFLTTTASINARELGINDVFYLDKDRYLIYGGIDLGYYPYQSQDFSCFAYLAYYEDGEQIWEKVFNNQRYGYIRDLCKTKDGIALILDYDSHNQGRNIKVYEMSLNQEILYSRELSGSKDDYGNKIFYQNNSLYLVGTYRSSDGDYLSSGNDNNILVGKLFLDDQLKFEMVKLGNSLDDLFYDAVFYDDKIYLLCRFLGNGYFYNDGYHSDFDSLIYVTDRMDIGEWISVDDNHLNTCRLAIFQDKIQIISSQKNKFRINIYGPRLENLGKYDFQTKANVLDLNFSIGTNLLISYLTIEENKKVLRLCLLDENYQIQQNKKQHIPQNSFRLARIYYESDEIILSILDLIEGKLNLFAYDHYQLQEKQNEYQNYTHYCYEMYHNGLPIRKTLIRNAVPENAFGTYFKTFVFHHNNKKFYLDDQFYFPLQSNIRNHEVYDLGISLLFNGHGKLNGTEIASGTKIEIPGHYLLEVSSDNQISVLTFSVEDLSIEGLEEEKPNLLIEAHKEVLEKDNQETLITLSANNKQERINYRFYLYPLSLLLGAVFGLLLPKIRFKGRKNA
jgi:hypothetical protein